MNGRQQPEVKAAQSRVEISEVTSSRDLREAMAIRRVVFTDEQQLTDVVDNDPYDTGPGGLVVLARLNGEPVATGRLHTWRGDGQIAWVAVLAPYRGQGLGWQIMDTLLSAAGRLGAERVTLSAQTHALGFYRLLGFEPLGNPFIMGNIEHITMVRRLDGAP